MGFLLSGFTVKQNLAVQNSVSKANAAIGQAYAVMTNIRKTGLITKEYLTYFGVADKARIDKVWKRLNMMNYASNASFITYERRIGKKNTAGAAQKPLSGWSEKDVKTMLDSGQFRMKIDDGFYRRGGVMSYAQAGPTPEIEVMVHELSHLVANTDDEPCPWDTEDAYGMDRAQRLAREYPDKAINNADNYGLFVTITAFGDPQAGGIDDAALDAVGSLF